MYKRQALDTVTFEDTQGAYAATRYLITLGHRRIGYIGGDEQFSSNRARWQGYADAMRDFGVPVDPQPVSYTNLRAHETVLEIVCRLLLEKKKTNRQKNYSCKRYKASNYHDRLT